MEQRLSDARVLRRMLQHGGIRLFSVFGIEIRLHYTWFIIVALIGWSLAAGYFSFQLSGQPSWVHWVLGYVTAVIFFACILAHEIGHSYVSQKLKLPVPRINLFIFGGAAEISHEPSDPATELRIAIAGPIVSGILTGVFAGLALAFQDWYQVPAAAAVFGILAVVNGAVAVFNLVPGFPLDGGRLLRAYLWRQWQDLQRATSLTARVGQGFAIALIVWGFFQVLLGGLVGGIWLVLIGFFIHQAAASSYQRLLVREGLSGTKVQEVMSREVVTVDPSLVLSRVVEDYFLRYHYRSYPVVRDGTCIGTVQLEHLKEVRREEWDEHRIKGVVEPIPDELQLSPRDDAADALSKMARSGRGRLPVLKNQQLVGVLTRRDIMTFLRVKTDLGLTKGSPL